MEKEDGQSRLVEVVNDYFESHIKTGRHAAIKAKLVHLDVLEHVFGYIHLILLLQLVLTVYVEIGSKKFVVDFCGCSSSFFNLNPAGSAAKWLLCMHGIMLQETTTD